MSVIRKTFEIEVLEKRKDGGRIAINTASVDRDHDRVFPLGVRTENYLKNPVVQWGHNYRDPWATVGKSNTLELTPDAVIADFELRPAANDQDPQNIVKLLWEGGWVKTASIGFIPVAGAPNDLGGTDYAEWELLEWSLVPIPSNQDALRLAVKGFELQEAPAEIQAETKRGRVLSAKNEDRIRAARDSLNDVLKQLEEQPADDEGKMPRPGVTRSGDAQKPYPNEHACRLRDPGDFEPDSFRRTSREHEGKQYDVIMGRIKGETAMTEQAYRYPKDVWSEDEASTHCKGHEGAFEQASGDGRGLCVLDAGDERDLVESLKTILNLVKEVIE